jgi:hypothetical protein
MTELTVGLPDAGAKLSVRILFTKNSPKTFKNVPIYLLVYFLIIIHDLFDGAVSCAEV